MTLDVKNYKKQIVIFLDLLGIKDFIARYESTQQKRILDLYQSVLGIIEYKENHFVGDELDIDLSKILQPHYSISGLSDSVIITLDYDRLELFPFILRKICLMQLSFIAKEVPVKGYVTLGKCYHDKTKSLIFGSGLIEAYQMEREEKYPRVVIDESVSTRVLKIYNRNELKRYIKRYQNEFPEMQGFEELFYIATKNLKEGIEGDKLIDNRQCARIDLAEVIERHKKLLVSSEGLNIRDLLKAKVEYYSKNDSDKSILEKWKYLQMHLAKPLSEIKFD